MTPDCNVSPPPHAPLGSCSTSQTQWLLPLLKAPICTLEGKQKRGLLAFRGVGAELYDMLQRITLSLSVVQVLCAETMGLSVCVRVKS